jgi:hypothetical protein
MSVSRWRRNGWRAAERDHPLEIARASLDDAVPVLTADPTTTTRNLAGRTEKKEQLEGLTDQELLMRACRELALAVIPLAHDLQQHRESLAVDKTAEVAVLVRSLAQAKHQTCNPRRQAPQDPSRPTMLPARPPSRLRRKAWKDMTKPPPG